MTMSLVAIADVAYYCVVLQSVTLT